MSDTPLTNRDAWAATFEHALSLDEPRTDCPLHMPDAPPIPPYQLEREANLPLNDLHHHIQNQGNISSWLQNRYATHAEQTHSWKKSKQDNSYSLVCKNYKLQKWKDRSWNVSRGDG